MFRSLCGLATRNVEEGEVFGKEGLTGKKNPYMRKSITAGGKEEKSVWTS